jgi:hypothetical protein
MAAKYVVIDRCPVPAKLAEEIREIKRISGASLNSCYRGTDAEHLLRKYGKSSQRQLFVVAQQGRGNPANPPGFSTHELRNDGAAYRYWPRGARIPYWAVGMDWDNPAGAMAAARKRGFTATTTYPNSAGERQHVNFRREPKFTVLKPLRKGSKGPRVATLTARLAYLGYLPGVSPKKGTGGFGGKVEAAVKKFQHKHHQTADGIVGPHTQRQILASVAHTKKSRRAAAKKKGAKR